MIEYKIGDCLEFMKSYDDNYFDLVLTDPPYGIGESGKKHNTRINKTIKLKPVDYGNFIWDSKLPIDYFNEMKRVSKNQIIFGGNYYTDYLYPTSCWIVWDKKNTGDFGDCELAWTSFKTATRIFRYKWNGMLQEDMKKKEKRVYPTQKPIQLLKWCLNKYTNPSDKILDPFCGSGSTLRACRELNLDCTGFEKNKDAEQIIKERALMNYPELSTYIKV